MRVRPACLSSVPVAWAALLLALAGGSGCSLVDRDGSGEAMASPGKSPPSASVPGNVLGNVEGGDEQRLWQGIDDVVAGGVSTGKLEVVKGGAAGTGHAFRFTGNVVLKDFPFPYAGLGRVIARGDDGKPAAGDLSGYKGLEFWARGDGKRYFVRLADSEVGDYNYHHFVFTAGPRWKRFRVTFAELKQFRWGKQVPWTGRSIREVSFISYSEPGQAAGKIELFVDEVSLF